jgi:glycosyltransferase involved in cell wall biosynthesis
MSAPDVLFGLFGDVRRNSRALRQLRTIAGLGLRVDVLTLGPTAGAPHLSRDIRLRIVPQLAERGPRMFVALHRRFLEAARQIPATVFHASDVYCLPAMSAAAYRQKARLIYDARELYVHVAATVHRPWVRLFWYLVERRYIRRADAVFTVSPGIADRLAETYHITRPTVLFNAPLSTRATTSNLLRERATIPDDHLVFLHQGQLRKDRGAERLVEAMREIEKVVMLFLGDGPIRKGLEERVRRHNLQQAVRFLDPVMPDDLIPATASADVGVTLLEDTCLNHRLALPNKLFEYLAAGLPVMASNLPEIRRVIETHDVGLLVDPADPTALVRTIRRMAQDVESRRRWAANAANALACYSGEQSAERLRDVYARLL